MSDSCIARARSGWPVACRCEDCTVKRRKVRKLSEAGLPTSRATVDQAMQVLDLYLLCGYNSAAIASITGVPRGTAETWILCRRRGATIQLGPATRDLVVTTFGQRPTTGRVGAAITRRKLHALAHQGWSPNHVGVTYGIPVATLYDVAKGSSDAVRIEVAACVDKAFNDLRNKTGLSEQVRRKARHERWPAIGAWDNIDNPREMPKGVPGMPVPKRQRSRPRDAVDPQRVEQACSGHHDKDLTHAERTVVVNRLRDAGLQSGQITTRAGITKPERYYNHHERIPA